VSGDVSFVRRSLLPTCMHWTYGIILLIRRSPDPLTLSSNVPATMAIKRCTTWWQCDRLLYASSGLHASFQSSASVRTGCCDRYRGYVAIGALVSARKLTGLMAYLRYRRSANVLADGFLLRLIQLDSGHHESSQSSLLQYDGLPLPPRRGFFCRFGATFGPLAFGPRVAVGTASPSH